MLSCSESPPKNANADGFIKQTDSVVFMGTYKNVKSRDIVELAVKNNSIEKTYYYSIGVAGLTDTGWVGLTADINSLGKNDFFSIKPIEPLSEKKKLVSKRKIFLLYDYCQISEIKFFLIYYDSPIISNTYKKIELQPMNN